MGIQLYQVSIGSVGTSYLSATGLENAQSDNPPARGEIVRVDVKITAGAGTTVDVEVWDLPASGYKLAESVGAGLSVVTLLTPGAAYNAGGAGRANVGCKVKTDDAGAGTTVLVRYWIRGPDVQPQVCLPQPWDAITVAIAPTDGQPLLFDPTVRIRRVSDGLGLLGDGVTWDASDAALAMPIATMGDLYYYAYTMDADALDRDAGAQGYIAVVSCENGQYEQPFFIPTIIPDPDRDATAHRTTGTFGELEFLTAALRQKNSLWVPDAWSAAGHATHGYVYVYETQAALDADSAPYSGAYAVEEVTLTYDGSNRLTYYESKDA